MTVRFVAYLRVSTAKQGVSGLGLEAQREVIARHVGGSRLVAEFVEIESGKVDERPQLQAALAMCRRQRAVLVIAKLDRLSRSVKFIATIMDSGVEFMACDLPAANRLTLHLMAAMAEFEREQISARTKSALRAKKARGEPLGFADPRRTDAQACGRKGSAKAAAASATARKAAAERRATDVIPVIEELRREGAISLREIADGLNQLGETTARGGTWRAETVRRVLNAASSV